MATTLVLVIVLLLCQSLLSKPFNQRLNELSMEFSTRSTFFELSTNHHWQFFCGDSSNRQTEISQIFNKPTNLRVKLNHLVKCSAHVGNFTELGSNVRFKSELIAVTKDREAPEHENPCPETSNHHYYLNHLFNSNVSYNEKNHFSHSLLQYDRFGRLSHYCIRITPFIPDKSCSRCGSYSSYQKFTIINDPLRRAPNPVTCENLTLNYDLREEMTFANGVSSPSGSITFRFGKFINFESCKYPSLKFLIANSLNGDQLTYSVEPQVVEVIKMNFVLKTGPTVNSTLTECLNDTNSSIADSKMIKVWHGNDYDDDELNHRGRRKSVEFSNLIPGVKYCLIISVLKPKHFGASFKGKNFHLDKMIIIPENVMADPSSTILPVTIEDKVWINILIVIVFVCSLVSALCFWKYLVQKDPIPPVPKPQSVIQTVEDSHFLNEEIKPTPIEKITILYTHETKEIEEAIEALVEFLEVSCNAKILFDKHDLVKVLENPFSYYASGHQFLFIETEGAVLREKKYLKGQRTHHNEEDALDDFYLFSLIKVLNSPDVMTNYSRYIVVRFSFSKLNEENHEFSLITHNKRYKISNDLNSNSINNLAQLCYFINHGTEMLNTTDNLKRFRDDWEGTPQFMNLSSAIKMAAKFVKENPNYADKCFRVSSESLSDTENDRLLSNTDNVMIQTHL